MSSILSFDIISVVVLLPNLKIFLFILVSVADTAAINPNEIKTLLANGLITFLLMVILFLVMDQEVYREIFLVVST